MPKRPFPKTLFVKAVELNADEFFFQGEERVGFLPHGLEEVLTFGEYELKAIGTVGTTLDVRSTPV
jgi:hypothetical protein